MAGTNDERQRSSSRCWTRYLHTLEITPLSGCGLSLGCMGLQSVVDELSNFYSLPILYYVISCPFLGFGLVLMFCYFVRGFCMPQHICKELQDPKSVAVYATLFMAFPVSLHTMMKRSVFSIIMWSLSIFLLLIIMVIFVFRIYTLHPYQFDPVPFWYPPTIGIAVLGWTAVSLNAPRVVLELFLWIPAMLCFVLVPVISFRIIKDRTVSNDCTIFIEAAPFPLVTVSWIVTGGSQWISSFANFVFISTLFILGNIAFFITIYSVHARWDVIYNEMGHKWASLTFPLIIYPRSALLFRHYILDSESEIVPDIVTVADSLNTFVFIWSSILCTTLLPLVALIIIGSSMHLFYTLKSKHYNLTEQLENEKHDKNIYNGSDNDSPVIENSIQQIAMDPPSMENILPLDDEIRLELVVS